MPMTLYTKLILKKKKKRKNSPPYTHTQPESYPYKVQNLYWGVGQLGSTVWSFFCIVCSELLLMKGVTSSMPTECALCQLCSLLIKHTLVPAHSSILYQEHCSNNKAGIDFSLTSSPHSHLCQHFYFFN